MTTVDFDRDGGDAMYSLGYATQVAVLDRLEEIGESPEEELESDSGHRFHYAYVETGLESYTIVVLWDRLADHVQVKNVGPSDIFVFGNP